MWYAIISQDIENSLAGRDANRPAHVARLKELAAADRLLIAGPHPKTDTEGSDDTGFSGSLIVADFETLAEAQAWVDSDPYVIHGVHESVTVKPFKKVLP